MGSVMRVLVLHSRGLRAYPSGELGVIRSESEALRKRGIEVRVRLFGPNETRQTKPVSGEMRSAYPSLWSFSRSRDVLREIDSFRPDVLHIHNLIPYLSPSILSSAHRRNVPTVQTLHNGRWLCIEGGFNRNGRYCEKCVGKNGWAGVLHGCNRGVAISTLLQLSNLTARGQGRLYRWVDRFIAVSDYVRNQHIRSGFPKNKVVLKNNGIDLSLLARSKICGKEKAGFGFIGRVSQSKGTAVVRRFLTDVREPFHIIGDGPDVKELRTFCENSGHDHVVFWGKQDHTKCLDLMASLKGTLVPSQCGEAFSLVAIESMGVGTPVIGSDIGGLGTLIRESGGGIAVDAEDLNGFVTAASQLSRSDRLANELGRQGAAYVAREFNLDQKCDELIDIYRTAIAAKKEALSGVSHQLDL